MTTDTSVIPRTKQRRRRGKVLRGGRKALSPKQREHHARLLADGSRKSGRSGAYVYYMDKGRQRWRRYVVPKDPRTARQQHSRGIFAAVSRTWSEDETLTEAQRHRWYADGAKRRSRTRLGQSGSLTGQQNYVGRKYAKEWHRSEMLLAHPNPKAHSATAKRRRPELTAQIRQPQILPQATTDPRRAFTVVAPSLRRVPRGYARKSNTRQLMTQVLRLQRFTKASSDRPQTGTRVLPGRGWVSPKQG